MKKLLFINTFHSSTDDRTFYHQAKSLVESGHEVYIFSSFEVKTNSENGVQFCSQKINTLGVLAQLRYLISIIRQYQPYSIICDSPTGILAAKLAWRPVRIIYDVTEWIPSKKHLKGSTILTKTPKFIILLLINLLAGLLTDKFIFGEYHKSLIFKLFFWKKKCIVPYYPSLSYIPYIPPRILNNQLCIYYSGWFNVDKGFSNVIELTKLIALKAPDTAITLELTGKYESKTDELLFEKRLSDLPGNVTVGKHDFLAFPEFCKSLSKADIFLDLRINDFENTHCLPIKLFYYMACGRPVIYNKLKAIEREVKINEIGMFLENNNFETIACHISDYIHQPEKFNEHCENARKQALSKYNWEIISPGFVRFVID